MQLDLAFIGTGRMGAPMAMRLLSAGHRLSVWNRDTHKTRELGSRGASIASGAAQAVTGASIAITMLSDGEAVTEVLFGGGVAEALAPGATLIDMSSIPPSLAREHARALAARGIGYLDAPVSGGTRGAREGTLAIMVGGEQATFDAVRRVLELMGRPAWVGLSGSGQLAKLANQAIVAVTIGAVAEALLLAAAGGADPAKVREALSGGFADSEILRQHGQRMLDRMWIPGGSVQTQIKDLRTIGTVAAELNLRLPLTGEASRLFESALNAGLAHYDHSALLMEVERRNPGVRVGAQVDRAPE